MLRLLRTVLVIFYMILVIFCAKPSYFVNKLLLIIIFINLMPE